MHGEARRSCFERLAESKVALCLELSKKDVTSPETVPPLYVVVPRLFFLPSLLDRALQQFQHVLPPGEHTPWFEHGVTPLKWHIPVGVLHDIYAGGQPLWRITVHFSSFPGDTLLPYKGPESLVSNFWNALKEACHVCEGSAEAVMKMPDNLDAKMKDALLTANAVQFLDVSAALGLRPRACRQQGPWIPLRLFVVPSSGSRVQQMVRPVPAFEAGVQAQAPLTLRTALAELLPMLLHGQPEPRQARTSLAHAKPRSSVDSAAGVTEPEPEPPVAGDAVQSPQPAEPTGADPGTPGEQLPAARPEQAPAGDGGAVGGPDHTIQLVDSFEQLSVAGQQVTVLVGGVQPPLSAPVAWLYENLRQADCFLCIVVHLS